MFVVGLARRLFFLFLRTRVKWSGYRLFALEVYLAEELGRSVSQVQNASETKLQRTAHVPATEATMPELMAMGLTPLVLLKMAPLSAPATTLFVMSCFPR